MPEIAQALSSLLALPTNWDSYGARPVNPECVSYALQLLRSTMKAETPAPAVVPTCAGGVQIEWHTRGIDLEIEIRSPGQSSVLYEDHQDGTTWEGEVTTDLNHLRRLISTLSR
ncbi:MAG: hypothetical protein HY238_15465 [Acidobacteria bacterium]|nr:hypothetical protein [Acidobacteriota bacterium]